jgi:hypothetical protein
MPGIAHTNNEHFPSRTMSTSHPDARPDPGATLPNDLTSRVFAKRWVQLGWMIFLAVMVTKVAWPLRNIVLVCMVNGVDAYQEGVRVLPGKPLKFSNGVLVPRFLDFVTGMVAFFTFALGLTLLLILALRLYERLLLRKKPALPRLDRP